MLQYEYARSTLMNGLRLEDKLGVNPFKYGMIGSTDNHVSMSTTREENYFGKLPNGEPSPERTQRCSCVTARPATFSSATGS